MRTELWSIINVTPDSFFPDSRATDCSQIARMAVEAVAEGASVIDLGGMSTRPGHEDVPKEEELRRLQEAFRAIRRVLPDVCMSIDTFRAYVVEELHKEFGHFTVNDISGGLYDDKMFQTVGSFGLPYVMMSQNAKMDEMIVFFEQSITKASSFGVREIIIDPGFGFGKDICENFRILHRLSELKQFECKILVGVSRKRMVWQTLSTTPNDALVGTTALHFELLNQGADILRVHDTRAAAQIIKLHETYINTLR